MSRNEVPSRVLVTAAVGLLLTGCTMPGQPGQRARGSSNWCPPGQVCSDKTSHGLYFQFAELNTNSLPAIALGGTVSIRLYDAATNKPLEYRYWVDVDPPVAILEDHRSATIFLRGTAVGSGILRVYDYETGELFDQIPIVTDVPTSLQAHVLSWLTGMPQRGGPPKVHRSGSARIWLVTRSPAHRLVLDREARMGLAPETDGGDASPLSWNTFLLHPPETGDATVEYRMGNYRLEQVLAIADEVTDATGSLVQGSLPQDHACPEAPFPFVVYTSTADQVVAGSPITFHWSGPVQPLVLPGDPDDAFDNVAVFAPQEDSPGFVTITWSVPGASGTWSCWASGNRALLPTPPPGRSPARPGTPGIPGVSFPGQRAELSVAASASGRTLRAAPPPNGPGSPISTYDLQFGGHHKDSSDPPAVALGGTMSMTIEDPVTREPLQRRYWIDVDPPVAVVLDHHGARVTFLGLTPGRGIARVYDYETGTLLRQFFLECSVPTHLSWHFDRWQDDQDTEDATPPRAYRWGQAEVVLEPTNEEGGLVVDEGARIWTDGEEDGAESIQLSWNAFLLLPPRTGDATAHVQLGDFVLSTSIPVVDTFDELVPKLGGDPWPSTCPWTFSASFEATWHGGPVLGVPIALLCDGPSCNVRLSETNASSFFVTTYTDTTERRTRRPMALSLAYSTQEQAGTLLCFVPAWPYWEAYTTKRTKESP